MLEIHARLRALLNGGRRTGKGRAILCPHIERVSQATRRGSDD